ncbi:MAG: hypothetical protein LBB12_02310 [Holosporaceae bacterium]|nr:hypothetical protein [Holosporaceae bacterium]
MIEKYEKSKINKIDVQEKCWDTKLLLRFSSAVTLLNQKMYLLLLFIPEIVPNQNEKINQSLCLGGAPSSFIGAYFRNVFDLCSID